jgi:hypothetical protein
MNMARSKPARLHMFIRIPVDTPLEKILILKTAITEYMKARPREWLSLYSFRASEIVTDKGYVEYLLVVQHREKWQFLGPIFESKANLQCYCVAVMKQLDIHYHAPPLPIDVKYSSPAISIAEIFGNEDAVMNDEAFAEMFRSLALSTKIAG